MSVVDEIKSRLDIVTYIQQYTPLKKAGRSYKACCPFHSEKTPSFTVNPDTQSWRCFGACAEGGDVFSFAMKINGWTFTEAIQELGRLVGVETRQQTPQQREQSEQYEHLRGLLKVASAFYHAQLTQSPGGAGALKYAREKRGFTDETISRFMVGYAPAGWHNLLEELRQLGYSEDQAIEAGVAIRSEKGSVYDRFRNRLMIPIRDERGRVIGFGARALDPNDNPKYLNSPQSAVFDKSKTLFGLDTGKKAIRDSETAIIVEGYMDAIQAQQVGFLNVVAQMGTALTESQLQLLSPRYAKKIILALDSDAAGQTATMRSLEVARQALQADYAGRLSVDIRVLHLPGAKDPDDLIREAPERWGELVAGAIPVADYVIEMETSHLPQNATLQEREEIAKRVLPMLTASENDLYRKDNLQKLALRLRIGERDLMLWASEQVKRQKPALPSKSALHPTVDDLPDLPPINYEGMLPPDETEGGSYLPELPVTKPGSLASVVKAVTQKRDYPLEAYCLRILLTQPEMVYTVNRKFRELARGNASLTKSALCDLNVDDFQNGDYRALMQTFKMAIHQDEVEIVPYLRQNLDARLLPVLERLFVEEADTVRERLRQRFDGDAVVSWRQFERRKNGVIDPTVELLDKALRLRLQRLQRETQEMQFLQMDADDSDGELYIQQIVLAMQAKRLIETELKQLSRYFV
jgi:DNA primase